MAGTGQTAVIAAFIAALLAGAVAVRPAAAPSGPLPPPAPPPETGVAPAPPSVVVRDRKLATQDLYPLSQTPLRYLLTDRIDLLRDTNVVAVHADDVYVTISIEEKQAIIGTSRLMMMFGAKDLQLKQWVVTDPQGFDTTIAISNLDSARRPDPSLFKIDYTDYTR